MPICFLGIIGDCSNEIITKETRRQQLKKLNEFLNERIISVFAESQTSVENIQEIFAEAEGNIIISDIDLKQYAKITSNTKYDIKNIINDHTNIEQIVNILAEISMDINSKMESGLSKGQRVTSETDNELIIEVTNQFKSVIKSQNIMTCVQNILNRQTISVKTKENIIIKGIKMDQTAMAVTECIMNNIMEIFNQIDIKEDIESKIQDIKKIDVSSKGFLDSLLGQGIGIIKYIIIGIIVLIVSIILVVISIVTLKIVKRRSKMKSPMVKKYIS